MDPEISRRCTCGGLAPVVSAERVGGELPRRLPEGIAWTHACAACGAKFVISPITRLVLFQVVLAGVTGLLIFEGLQSADRITGRAVLFVALSVVGWLARVAWVTLDRLRLRWRHPLSKGREDS